MLIDGRMKYAVCGECGKTKPLGDFYVYETAGRLYASSLCKKCKKERVRMFYYLKRNGYIREDLRTKEDDDDEDNDGINKLFEVRGKTVFAHLIWYELHDGWHDEFVPIIKFDSPAMCYKCITILKDLSTAELKRMRAEYIKRSELVE